MEGSKLDRDPGDQASSLIPPQKICVTLVMSQDLSEAKTGRKQEPSTFILLSLKTLIPPTHK